MIQLNHLYKTYQTKHFTQNALEEINLKLPSYGMVFISGKSGCGKSTLLNILGGIDSPSSGELYYEDEKIDYQNQRKLNSYRLNEISFIFQKFNLLENEYVYHNVDIQGAITGQQINQEKILKCLDQVGLTQYVNHKANQLSIGQQQRVAISRALFKDSKILIADEPTSHLDSQNSLEIFKLLKVYSKNHLVIVASHDIDMIHLFSDMTIYMEDGKITSIASQIDENNTVSKINKFNPKKVSGFFIWMKSLSFIKQRSIRSLFTLVLSLMTIVFFGISLTFFSLDRNQIVIDSLNENSIHHVQIVNANVDSYTNELDGEAFGGRFLNIDPLYKEELHLYWSNYTTEIKTFDTFDLPFMHGRAPKNYYEIAVTDYLGYKTIHESFDNQISLEDLIGLEFTFNVAGRDKSFILVVSGIIQTDFSRKNQYGMVPIDILSDSHYVLDGFMDYHLEDMIYANGGFILSHSGQVYNSLEMVIDDALPTIAKASKLSNNPHLIVVTEDGMINLNSFILNDNEVILPLHYYNVLFRNQGEYITKDNIHSSLIDYGSTFVLNYKDQRLLHQPEYQKQVVIKGIIYDDEHEPMVDHLDDYNYTASCIILSDKLFNECIEGYHLSYNYILNIKSFDVYQVFLKHYRVVNHTLDQDIIITPFDTLYVEFNKNIQRFSDLFIMVCITFAVFSVILIYYNTSSNIEIHQKEIGIYRSMGLSRFNIFQLFIIENMMYLIIIIPSALYIILLFTQSLNQNIIIDNYQIELLRLTIPNMIFIMLFTVTLLIISLSEPLVKLLRKTPVEIIRLD